MLFSKVMNDIKIIKLFNPDLNNLSNQLLIIELKKNKYNDNKYNDNKYKDRILSIQHFMEKYSYYNNDEYKYFYPELTNYSKLDLMVHWHNIGIYNNEYCSINYFYNMNPAFNLELFKEKYLLYRNYTLIDCIKVIIQNNIDICEEEIIDNNNIEILDINDKININNKIKILDNTEYEILKNKYSDFNLEEYKKLNKSIVFDNVIYDNNADNDIKYIIDYDKNSKNRIYSVFHFLESHPEFTLNIEDDEENIYDNIHNSFRDSITINPILKSNPPIITFIIPSIGRETLKNTVKSLLNLKNTNWLCIIIFDGIKQNITIEDNRFTIYETEKKGEKNYGGYVRNLALQKNIETTWVGFVDDDDTISNKYIDYLLEESNKYQNVDVIIFRMMYQNGVMLPEKNDKNIIMNKVGISFAIHKNIFEKKKYFFKNNAKEDYCFLRMLQKNNYKILISGFIAYFVRMSKPIKTKKYNSFMIS